MDSKGSDNIVQSQGQALSLEEEILGNIGWHAPPIEQTIAAQMATSVEPEGKKDVQNKLLGSKVKISGVAKNAFLGAVVVCDESGSPYYIDKLDEWDDDIFSKRILVEGILRRKKLAPDPVVGPNNEQSHGKFGHDDVLEECKWILIQ